MKKLLILIMTIAMAMCFAGCGSSQTEETAEPEEAVSGGWEVVAEPADAGLPEDVQNAFDAATENMTGNELTPIAYFSKQIVSGTNYQILCQSMPAVEEPIPELQVAVIYQDLEGNAEITNIADFDIANYSDNDGADVGREEVTGGWEVPEDYTQAELPDNVREAFEKAIEQVGGSTFTPMAYLGSQVVAGTNYAVLMEGELASQEPVSNIQVAIVYEDLDGNAELTNICTLDPADFTQQAEE
ncbi:MAG: hypothetical protein Q4A65_07070 [Bacillota bacterium]|nr:hypothetical protein [Bacillota bacterium]